MGHRLIGRPLHVDVQQRDGEGAVWLEVEHDGWVHDYGLLHQRRLYLDQRLDELRALQALRVPLPLIDGIGRNWGLWRITMVQETQTCIIDDGTAMVVDWTLELSEFNNA